MFEKFIFKVGAKIGYDPALLLEMAPVLLLAGTACIVTDLMDNSKQKDK